MKRVPLIVAPTPVHRLGRVSTDLGIDLWIKRDDLTGFALGGNKGRKLEYLMAAAVDEGAEVVVTCGSVQSNFIRQLAAACSVCGMTCAAAVMPLPYEFESLAPVLVDENGNALLERLLGADVRVFPNGTWEDLYDLAETLAREYESAGKRVYRIPIGGSTPLGAFAFYQAGLEVGDSWDSIVFASSSGSTHTGLQYAFQGRNTRIVGIACDPEPDIINDFAELYNGLAQLVGETRPMARSAWQMNFDFVGAGYGVPSPAGDEAIAYLARREGIFLDPIYSGKAFAATMALAREGELPGRTLFWHTGGVPALFAVPPRE